jgi:hypothetical protein
MSTKAIIAGFLCLALVAGCGGKKGGVEEPAGGVGTAAGEVGEPSEEGEPAGGETEETGGEEAAGAAEAGENEEGTAATAPKGIDEKAATEEFGDLFMARKFTARKDLGPLADQVPKGFNFNKKMLIAAKNPNWWLAPTNTKPAKIEIIEVSKGEPPKIDEKAVEEISEEPTYKIAKKKMVVTLVTVTVNNPEGCYGGKGKGKGKGTGGAAGETDASGAIVVTLYAVPRYAGVVEISRTAVEKTCPGH